jgi:hypothetical protein
MIKPHITPIIAPSPTSIKKRNFLNNVSQSTINPIPKAKYGKFFTITADKDSAVSGSWDKIQKIRYE